MKILFVIDSLGSGGAQRQMVTLALDFKQQGHSTAFFLYAEGDHFAPYLEEADIPIYTHLKRSRYSLDVFVALRRRLKEGQYDIVLSFLTTPNFYNAVVSRTLLKRPVSIVSERSYDPPQGASRKIHLIRQAYRLVDYVTVNSHHQRENFLHLYPWLRDRIITIYNGLDIEHFHPPQAEPPTKPFKILCIGRIVGYKNVLCLVKALAILRDTYQVQPQVNWVGRIEDQTYFDTVHDEITKLNLDNQWTWLYQRHDIVDLLHQHHVLVHPSYFEGLSNVICEALSSGRPVITNSTLENPKLIQHGESGYLFENDNPEDLAMCIKTLMDDSDEKRQQMGQAARAYAEANLSIEQLTSNYRKLFEELLSK